MENVAQFYNAQQRLFVTAMLSSGALILLGALLSLGFGPAGWDWQLAIAWLHPSSFEQFTNLQINIVTEIRLPRFCLAMLVGLVLAQTGTATQALCRNPLADPSIIGVTAGAAVAAVLMIGVGYQYDIDVAFWLPIASFIGALSVTALVAVLSTRGGAINVTNLILVGVALNALAFAVIGLVSFYADDSALRLINYWTMGSLAGATWSTLFNALPLMLISIVGLCSLNKKLNVLLLGESEAKYLGLDVSKLKHKTVIFTAIGVGATVSMTGMIGFIGLIVPHISRMIVGPKITYVMPLSMAIGAAGLLLADWAARNVVSPAELPIGIITALIGAPFFLYLLIQQRSKHA